MGTNFETPLASDYLELRADLSTALFALTTLASDAHSAPDLLRTLQDLQTGLREPFLFVVAGEVKAGKSSLLNALFGRDFCRVDVLPATDRVHVFKYGDEPKDVPISPSLIERYQPIEFLRDFNIVDTPGTNTIVSEHEEITERFVPQADLIIFVFSVVNPWGASAWEFLALLQKKWLKNVIFVLQQMDLRAADEVEAVSQHLRQTAMQRLGQALPIFAVSAKKAWLAKTGAGEDKNRLWEESQFGPLEDHINGLLAGQEAGRSKLRSVCQTGQVILKDLSEQARNSEKIIAADREQIERLKATVGQLKQRSYLQVEGFLRGVDTAYARCQREGEQRLQEKLGFVNSVKLAFVRNQQWQIDFQREMEAMLRDAITKQMERAVSLLEGELKAVWSQLHDFLQANFNTEARAHLKSGNADFTEQRARLFEQIQLAMMENMTDQEIQKQLEGLFAEVTTWGRVPLGAVAAGGIAGIIAAKLALIALVDITGVLASAVAVVGVVVGWGKRRKVITSYQEHMSAKAVELTDAIGDLMRQAIDLFFQRLGQVYQPLETFCNVQSERYRPLLGQVDALEKSFDKISARLDARPPA
jgi:GTPase SAR1 family protein